MKPKVLVTRRIPSAGIEILNEFCDLSIRDKAEPPTRNELINLVKDKDGLLCLLTDHIDIEIIESSRNLKVISSYSVGYDHIDIKEATNHGVYVTYTPGVLTEATADFTWALLMSVARRVVEADTYVRKREWRIGWSPTLLLGIDVNGKTLGIIGLGRIGSTVARRAMGFNMKILYSDVKRAPEEVEQRLRLEYVDLEVLLGESDFITIHVPLSKETHHLLDEDKLRLMKPTARLINTSRGAVVDQQALCKALKEKWIAGAALDVFESEPIAPDDPLLKLDNIVLAPHIGSATEEARSSMAELAAKNLLAVLKGEISPSLVNPQVQSERPLSDVKMI